MAESLSEFLMTLPKVLSNLVCSYIHPAFFELTRGALENKRTPYIAQYYMPRFTCSCKVCCCAFVIQVSELGFVDKHWNCFVYPKALQYICAGLGTIAILENLTEYGISDEDHPDFLSIAITLHNNEFAEAIFGSHYLSQDLFATAMEYKNYSMFQYMLEFATEPIRCLSCHIDSNPARQIEFISGAEKPWRTGTCSYILDTTGTDMIPTEYAIFLIKEASPDIDDLRDMLESTKNPEVLTFIKTLL